MEEYINFIHLDYTHRKICQLKHFISLKNVSNIEIFFVSERRRYVLIQSDTDISLTNELKIILQASLEIYEQELQKLNLNF